MRDKILACRWNRRDSHRTNDIWNIERANTVEYWKVEIIAQGDGGIQLRNSGIIGVEMVWQRRDECWGSNLV